MISRVFSKLAAWRKWIFVAGAAWTIVLVLAARGTTKLRPHPQDAFESPAHRASGEVDTRLHGLREENSRLQNELKDLPELNATATELRKEIDESKAPALWAGQSNALQAAIEQKQRELAEVSRWSTEWQKAEQRAAAAARLAEKMKEASADPEKEYAQTKETLSKLALARKRIIEIRKEWVQLDKSEKEQFRPRLEEAQAQWMEANNRLGKDEVLYRGFPLTNSAQDPATVLLMRSIIPDQNGMSISVFLDGTVNMSKANEN